MTFTMLHKKETRPVQLLTTAQAFTTLRVRFEFVCVFRFPGGGVVFAVLGLLLFFVFWLCASSGEQFAKSFFPLIAVLRHFHV